MNFKMHPAIAAVAEQPFYGAAKTLRHYNPLYQSEIGVEREWEVRLWNGCCCSCRCCCDETAEILIVLATTAFEACQNAEAERENAIADGVRVRGSNGDFADAYDLKESQ